MTDDSRKKGWYPGRVASRPVSYHRMEAGGGRGSDPIPQPGHELRVDPARAEIRVPHRFEMKWNGCRDPLDHELLERADHTCRCFLPCVPVRKQLGEERIVVGRHTIAGIRMRIDTDARSAWRNGTC